MNVHSITSVVPERGAFVLSLPTATVTFLFTDIEGSTLLLERVGDRQYADVLQDHHRLLRAAFAQGGGHEIDTQGDSFFVAFQSARDAVCRFCGRGICQEHVRFHPYILSLFTSHSTEAVRALVVEDALHCGVCKPRPEPVELPELG